MKSRYLILSIISLSLSTPFSHAQAPKPPTPERTEGAISQITLYKDTALITRVVNIPASRTGAFELVVENLPTATDPSSVFADSAEGIEIRSVTCRQRPTAEAARVESEISQLDNTIEELKKQQSTARNEIALRRIRQEYLNSLAKFVAPAAKQEMTHGVLQAEELAKVTQMHFNEYETASQEIMKLDFEIEAIGKKLRDFSQERGKLAAGPTTSYDAIIYVEKRERTKADLELNYLVKDCGWTPIYNVRGNSETDVAELEFNALIHQVSGENWTNAKLALSTASPNVSAYNPKLSPLYVRVGNASENGPSVQQYSQAVAQRSQAVKGQLVAKSINETASANFAANESAASVQLIELSERLSALRQIDQESTEEIKIQYHLPQPVTLLSRRDAQMVPVLSHNCPASHYHVAIPILTTSVFREAQLTNAGEHDLLAGQVNVYLDSEFIGRTEIPTIARGTRFTLGFGVDGQARARRTLVDRTDTVQGGNRHVTISCEVVVDSFKDKVIALQIRERMPFMEDAMRLRATMDDSSHPMSQDPDYRRFEFPKGILRWDLEIEPGSADKASTLAYTYSLEFDKSQTVQDITNETKSRLKTEFLEKSKSVYRKR